jgi:transcriptional regulator with XRE-family HTH domain
MTNSNSKRKKNRRVLDYEKRTTTLKSFGNCIRKIREQKGLTPTELARKAGLDSANLNKYETGIREPGLLVILLIAEGLKVNPLDLCNCRELKQAQLTKQLATTASA